VFQLLRDAAISGSEGTHRGIYLKYTPLLGVRQGSVFRWSGFPVTGVWRGYGEEMAE
jgi:hypothetical protein